jgi:hypothetical protein
MIKQVYLVKFIIIVVLILYLYLFSAKIVESFNTKKTIVFIISGNSRTSPFSHNPLEGYSDKILESYNEFVFTKELKQEYNFRVYISCDDIDIQKAKDYFGENLANVHSLDSDFYLNNIVNKKRRVEDYFIHYNNKDWNFFRKYDNSIHQHYKIMDSYNLFLNDNIKCDYIVRMRMDIKINTNIIHLLNQLNNNRKILILMDWDLFALGRPDIMHVYCTGLDNKYGHYEYNTSVTETPPVMSDYHTVDKKVWTYSPERQLFEMIYEYCNKNNYVINDSIKSIPQTSSIMRK